MTFGGWEARLKDRDVTVRLRTVQEIAGYRDHALIPLLLRSLSDRSNFVVAAAATGLAALRDEQAVAPLIERYWWLAEKGPTRDPTCAARIGIVSALVACQATTAGDVYLHAIKTVQVEPSGMSLEDIAVPLRIEAAVALASFRTPGALLPISLLLHDPTAAAARVAAAKALGHLGDLGAVAVLGVRLARPAGEDGEILVSCMDALADLDPVAAVEIISSFLESSDPYLVAGAATSLATLAQPHSERVISLLEAVGGKVVPEAREALILAIASIRADDVVESLSRLANHHDESVRLATVVALEQRGDPDCQRVLLELAERNGDRRVCGAARQALKRWRHS